MNHPKWPVHGIYFSVPPRGPKGRDRLSLLIGILLVIAVMATALTKPAEEAHAAEPSSNRSFTDYRPLTWNMQGSGVQGHRWATVATLAGGAPAIDAHNVVALQEVGSETSLPPNVQLTRSYNSGVKVPGKGSNTYILHEYKWNFRTAFASETRFLYFLKADFARDRGNLAMVTDRRATDWIFIDRQPQQIPADPSVGSGTLLGLRPAFGLKFSTSDNKANYFFTLHATARDGNTVNDADSILAAIDKKVPDGSQWAALGDYNQTPYSLTLPPKAAILRVHAATRQGGAEIDFMVSETSEKLFGWSGYSLDVGSTESDHWPIAFHVYASDRGIHPLRNREHPTQCLTAASNDLVSMTPCNGSPAQDWQLVDDAVVNTTFGSQCLDVTRQQTGNESEILAYKCNGQGNQRWEYQDNGTLVNTASKRCLDASRVKARLVIYRCNERAPNQQWILPLDKSAEGVKINKKDRSVSITHYSASGKAVKETNIGGSVRRVETSIHSAFYTNWIDVFAVSTNDTLQEMTFDPGTRRVENHWQEFKTSDAKAVPLKNLTGLSVAMDAEGTYIAVVGEDKAESGSAKTMCLARIRRTHTMQREPWTTPWTCSAARGYLVTAVQVPSPPTTFSAQGESADRGDQVYTFTYDNRGGGIFRQTTTYSARDNKLVTAPQEELVELPKLPAAVEKVTAGLAGTVVHLVVNTVDSGDNVYFLPMNTRSENWSRQWLPVGMHLAGLSITETPGQLLICGTVTKNTSGCATRTVTGDYASETLPRALSPGDGFKKAKSPPHLPPKRMTTATKVGIAFAILGVIALVTIAVVVCFLQPEVAPAAAVEEFELISLIAEGAEGVAEGVEGEEAAEVAVEAAENTDLVEGLSYVKPKDV
ncbi:ricin-type beta-trefoil lectin domain protein [Streptomyces sp. NPDC047968]|uniref:ricin-type beta-trefoil lectin domain protein n=1 Tax=unclassified Streptomyces TaxID=2593676 RepID=UPI0034181B20